MASGKNPNCQNLKSVISELFKKSIYFYCTTITQMLPILTNIKTSQFKKHDCSTFHEVLIKSVLIKPHQASYKKRKMWLKCAQFPLFSKAKKVYHRFN